MKRNLINSAQDRKAWYPFFHQNFLGYASIAPFWQKIMDSFLNDWPRVQDFNQLRQHHSFEFIAQTKDMKYEEETYLFNRVPMRPRCWHDFFNNLTWLIWPNLKRAIIDRIGQESIYAEKNRRTPRQNLLTHFDECGMVICSFRKDLFEYIERFLWKEFFFETQDLTTTCETFIIGHGLLEKALTPYIGMTAKAMFLPVTPDFFALPYDAKMNHIDKNLAHYICSPNFPNSPKSLFPFPLLGWPGFWPGNEDEAFFNNESYFRRKTY